MAGVLEPFVSRRVRVGAVEQLGAVRRRHHVNDLTWHTTRQHRHIHTIQHNIHKLLKSSENLTSVGCQSKIIWQRQIGFEFKVRWNFTIEVSVLLPGLQVLLFALWKITWVTILER